ncbi:MAG TPA: hypothetical protein VJT33_13200 [bacterium]|nr:hypothetical protein [bacterium]
MNDFNGKTRDVHRTRRVAARLFAFEDTPSSGAGKLGRRSARRRNSRLTRLKLLDASVQKAISLLPHVRRSSEMRQFAEAVAILIDRSRLEEGEMTSRVGVELGSADPFMRLAARLLLARWKRRPVTTPPFQGGPPMSMS